MNEILVFGKHIQNEKPCSISQSEYYQVTLFLGGIALFSHSQSMLVLAPILMDGTFIIVNQQNMGAFLLELNNSSFQARFGG